jgi:hypothetical protein
MDFMSFEEISTEEDSSGSTALFRLRVLADPDPGTLARVLERFQTLNVIPRRVIAEVTGAETLSIEIVIAGLAERRVALIAAKLGQIPTITMAHWQRIS